MNLSSASEFEARDQQGDDESRKVKEDPVTPQDHENSEVSSPPVPPRRKSQDKLRVDSNKENVIPDKSKSGELEASIKVR